MMLPTIFFTFSHPTDPFILPVAIPSNHSMFNIQLGNLFLNSVLGFHLYIITCLIRVVSLWVLQRFCLICVWISGNIMQILILFCILKCVEPFKINFCRFFITWGTAILVLLLYVYVFQHTKLLVTARLIYFIIYLFLRNSWISPHTTCHIHHPTHGSMCSLLSCVSFKLQLTHMEIGAVSARTEILTALLREMKFFSNMMLHTLANSCQHFR
jgi:hypothetical protein